MNLITNKVTSEQILVIAVVIIALWVLSFPIWVLGIFGLFALLFFDKFVDMGRMGSHKTKRQVRGVK